MKPLRSFIELNREMWRDILNLYLPTPKSQVDDFLNITREKVAYYQPKIEDMCELSLGKIYVKDDSSKLYDDAIKIAREGIHERCWSLGRVPSKSDLKFAEIEALVISSLFTVPLYLYNTLRGANMKYANNTVYVCFYPSCRFMDHDFKERKNRLDHTVVHELSHAVWEKCNPNIINLKEFFNEGRIWMEGFASYCAQEYFANLYPEGVKKDFHLAGVYKKGKNKIEGLVKSHGKEVVLEIPKRWREFSNITN